MSNEKTWCKNMKLFGINLSSDAQLHRDIDPNYSRFAPEKTRMAVIQGMGNAIGLLSRGVQ